jgi:large subunit ribosomal protein L32
VIGRDRWGIPAPPLSSESRYEETIAVAVPKKKKSKSKTRSHRAGAWKLGSPARSLCPRCGSAKLPHTVCPSCGWYKNRVAVEV